VKPSGPSTVAEPSGFPVDVGPPSAALLVDDPLPHAAREREAETIKRPSEVRTRVMRCPPS